MGIKISYPQGRQMDVSIDTGMAIDYLWTLME
jgi:hypothetical protein